MAGNKAEAQRLFRLGYDAGKLALERLRSGSLSDEHMRRHVPIGFTMRLGGPSIDFVLGRIYSGAVDDALDPIYESTIELGTLPRGDSLRESKAKAEYLN